VAGPPEVTSTDVSLSPATPTGKYTLTFNENVNDVADNLDWTALYGTGSMGTVTAVDPKTYTVPFSGITANDHYLLTVWDDITDDCGNPLSATIQIHLTFKADDVYSESFVYKQHATAACSSWQSFRAGLTGPYETATIRGTFDTTGVSCSGLVADQLCQALKSGTPTTVNCNGRTWHVADCGGFIEFASRVDTNNCICWTPDYSVRPCIPNFNWGGANTATCNSPSQTLEVVCGY